MRKGFSATLATVAIAMLGFNAMAMAPVIKDMPDIIVGNGPTATASNVFVFPDALGLNDYVADDDTTPGQILWSYSVTDPANPVYNINGVGPLDLSVGSRVTPGANRIDNQDLDPTQVDGNPRTITIRNVLRSPLPHQASYPDAPGSGIIDARTVTLHASDGSTASSKAIMIYTDDGGDDRFSPAEEIVYDADFTAGANGWSFAQSSGTVTSTQSASGLCLTVAAGGENDGNWSSQYGAVQLQQNSVWEARMTVTTTQTTTGQVPVWMLVYDNIGSGVGQNEYGGEIFHLDNEGGANSPLPVGRTGQKNFTFMMMPPQLLTPQFSSAATGMFTAVNDPNNDMRLIFRIFDLAGGGYGAELDSGTICLENIDVVRHDLADMVVDATPMNWVSNFALTTTDSTAPGLVNLDTAINTGMTFSGGNVTLAPTSGDWQEGVSLLHPGNNSVNFVSQTGDENRDNWPIAWKSDTIYYIEFTLSAPSAAAELSQPDVIRIGADVLSQELVVDHFLIGNTPDPTGFGDGSFVRGISTPRAGTPQKYACFWYSLSTSKTGIIDGIRWRPRFEVLNGNALQPLGRATANGGVTLHSMKVEEVHF